MHVKKIVWLIVILMMASQVSFTQEKESKMNKLSKKADVILQGKVVKKDAAWNANKTRIYTKVTLKVDKYLKGKEKKETIDLTIPGGELGDVGELYTHLPVFEEEEEVILFLKKDKKNNGYKVLHGDEGKIRINREHKK